MFKIERGLCLRTNIITLAKISSIILIWQFYKKYPMITLSSKMCLSFVFVVLVKNIVLSGNIICCLLKAKMFMFNSYHTCRSKWLIFFSTIYLNILFLFCLSFSASCKKKRGFFRVISKRFDCILVNCKFVSEMKKNPMQLWYLWLFKKKLFWTKWHV